ncbi:uncharacterized protein BDZ83DRAFT_385527 [Colletotrichum acutatum]|uniref:Uncharacterized protein n=1 Tax=Glomerella acutata TaxID=27357 RepID=A0AAD8ULP5_GLOAC|nr:uncharacterized protein BDZ83DRAFT_385527 [Colletotrichum acutatum]KAK1723641.1 hypothetical protein BDZ83DRAFT_385527 [Colletotrichum acutatum]
MIEPPRPRALLTAIAAEKGLDLNLAQLLVICANLVVLDGKCDTLRFSHRSVRDFLSHRWAFLPGTAHHNLASLCIGVCSRGLDPVSIDGVQIPSDDFYTYASMYWPVHSKLALKFGKDTLTTKRVENDVTTFIFDEDWDTTLC